MAALRIDLQDLSGALKASGLDAWLLYDFKGANPIARRVAGIGGFITRRVFVWLPATGGPVALVHRIERHVLPDFPGEVRVYGSWRELQQQLALLLRGRRVAMEVSPDGDVPYLDRVPSGAAKLLERLGATIVSSAPLISRFAAGWSATDQEEHQKAAERIARIAREAVAEVVTQAGSAREAQVQARVRQRMEAAGLIVPDPPIVAFQANAANPHYEPREGADAVLQAGQVVLLDLWARTREDTVFADQTWMGFAGGIVPDEVARVWAAVRDARDAVLDKLRAQWRPHGGMTGASLDDASRGLITERGYGEYFTHRTGHSIDADLHGSGPNIDNFETNDSRELLPGVGFSVEPGVYLEGNFGVRSEVNVYLTDNGPVVTPAEIQRELILPA
ncbi:MAG TPA: M24 family metallopeptidase [Gemmatimonadales bacterium]|jgi:Xaa-Pro aminopeptidase|nr:M24 family metallopeptidase [Gemmatimonadales bacterium]